MTGRICQFLNEMGFSREFSRKKLITAARDFYELTDLADSPD